MRRSYFKAFFFLGCDRAKDIGALDGPVAVLHMLGQSRMRPFSFFRRRHVLFVTDVEAAGCLADVRLAAFGAIIFVDALFVEGIRFGFVS